MALVFDNPSLDGRQLRHLMPTRVADVMARMQPASAVATRLRHEIDHRIHAFDRHQITMVPRMSRLAAGLAPTLHATPSEALVAREAI